jgi:hypothetical protein
MNVMIRMARWATRRARGEGGGVGTIVAIMFAGGAIFAAGAVSIDVADLLSERKQLQNGADASAQSVAALCLNAASCNPNFTSTGPGTINELAAKNAQDKATTISAVCRSSEVVSSTLPVCLSDTTNPNTNGELVRCPTLPASAATTAYVEAYTETKNTDGSNSITSKLASAVAGSQQNTTVKACARVGWGPAKPTTLNTLPIVMSTCDWQQLTGWSPTSPPTYPAGPSGPHPGYGTAANPWPAASVEKTVFTKGNPTTCTTWNGHTAPGGFSVLENTSCSTAVLSGDWLEGEEGNAVPCDASMFAPLRGTVVYVPVFDCLHSSPVTITPTTDCNDGNGAHAYYHVSNYAAFYLTGWYFSSSDVRSIRPGARAACSGGDRCIEGWFLQDLVPAAQITNPTPGGPPNMGLQTIKPLG